MAPSLPTLNPGDMAPAFTLSTSAGQDMQLTTVLHSSAAMVVFIRGTW